MMQTVEREQLIAGWNTDVVSILNANSHSNNATRLVMLVFLPGNPGCVAWYIPMLQNVWEQLQSPEYILEAHACSYAGHGVGDHKTKPHNVQRAVDAYTLEGQIEHKLAWIESLISRFDQLPRFIWLSHSIGSYLVNQMLLKRPNLLLRNTAGVIHLMPFIRFQPSLLKQKLPLTVVANCTHSRNAPCVKLLQLASCLASWLPHKYLDHLLNRNAGIQCPNLRQFTARLVVQPIMAQNFLTLGCREIRLLQSKSFNEIPFGVIGNKSPIAILYGGVGPDQWAPKFHMDELVHMRSNGRIPKSLHCTFHADLKHDFVVNTESMVSIVTQYVVRTINRFLSDTREYWQDSVEIRSRL